ncbi:hypothetical protein D3C71_1963290 [compost metagenome]
MGQLAAEGGLTDAQALGGVAEVLQLQQVVEGAQVGEAEGGEGGVHAGSLRWNSRALSRASPLPQGSHIVQHREKPAGAGLPANRPQRSPDDYSVRPT